MSVFLCVCLTVCVFCVICVHDVRGVCRVACPWRVHGVCTACAPRLHGVHGVSVLCVRSVFWMCVWCCSVFACVICSGCFKCCVYHVWRVHGVCGMCSVRVWMFCVQGVLFVCAMESRVDTRDKLCSILNFLVPVSSINTEISCGPRGR